MSHKSIKFLLSALALASASLLSAGQAQAQTVNTPLDSADVRANILSSCTVSGTTLAFGSYLSTGTHATDPLDAQSSVSVTCTAGTTGLVAHMLQGTAPGATCNSASNYRAMKHSNTNNPDWMSYKIYQDSERTLEWGCDASNQVSYSEFLNSGTAVVRTVYGRIPPGQYKDTGAYTDTIQFRITF